MMFAECNQPCPACNCIAILTSWDVEMYECVVTMTLSCQCRTRRHIRRSLSRAEADRIQEDSRKRREVV